MIDLIDHEIKDLLNKSGMLRRRYQIDGALVGERSTSRRYAPLLLHTYLYLMNILISNLRD